MNFNELITAIFVIILGEIFPAGSGFLQPLPSDSPLVIHDSSEVTSTESATVSRVIDGDTVELESGQKVRYIGIDTPETKDPRQEVQCFGQEAFLRNKQLVEGKKVTLVKDISEADRYGRLLRYVYIDQGLVNDQLVADGYARAVSYPPDVRYQERFLQSERQARLSNKGLWGSCL